ncbi:hypothetical protein [Companilactobacillus sp. DQM5]|uniref:hypothetical protein n=1 Tax=Companilactobacillus sp. DQM5 TaxID=3463359 RepID=UPI004059C113
MVEIILNENQKQEIALQIRDLINNEISRIKDTSNINNQEWFRKKEAIKYLRVSNVTFDKFRLAELPSHEVAGITLYNRHELDEFYLNH